MAVGPNTSAAIGARETVFVASKLPFPLILRACELVDVFDAGAKRMVKEAQELPGRFTINGVVNPVKVILRDRPQMAGGYAITANVPANIWYAWIKDNETSDYIKNEVIFGDPKLDVVLDRAKNNARTARSGLEPLNPDKIIKQGQRVPADPRIPHVIDPNEGPMA
jgi:hypothetical protein